MKAVWYLLRDAFWRWWNDNTFQLGAALAYYTVFSIAPIAQIAIAIARLIFGREAAQQQILDEIRDTVGTEIGTAVGNILQYTSTSGSTVVATLVSVVVLLIGASSVFAQLQEALNTI